ncbi:AraC family transcriptional regulator [Pseudokineococcus sp. 1T1Z-3]|uniref:AraC family transcriptional regulator n=1 Tax=Pseudokineococcus sp. 1T1Z-3 TaxID=3132745 RepID=UPI0030AE3E5D
MLHPTSLRAGSRLPSQVQRSSHHLGWQDVLARTYLEPREAETFTTAPTPDLLLVVQLAGTSEVESRRGRRWVRARYTPGSMGATAPGASARLRLLPGEDAGAVPVRTLHLHLGADLLQRTAETLGRPAAVRQLPDGLVLDDPGVRATARAVGVALARSADPLAGDALAQALAAQVLTLAGGPRATGGRAVTPLGATDLARVEEHMRAHLAEPVRLAELAAVVHSSPYHFVRRFRAATGTTPHRELVRLRVEHAAHLLRTTPADVRTVALTCGYASVAHFADAFRRHHGCTPGAYRGGAVGAGRR